MKLRTALATAAFVATAALGAASPAIAAESAWKAPTCSDHVGNTAVWTDCKGNGSASWIKLKYVCWTPVGTNYHETDWYPLGATERAKISEECTFEALDAYSTSRAR